MIKVNSLNPEAFLKKREEHIPVIDVRSPAEFEKGHMCHAHNIPLFSNEERKIVGTIYKQVGRQEAVLKGLEIIGPKMKTLAEQVQKIAPSSEVLAYCWRGGMRSYSLAWMLNLCGITTSTLKGGYKAYRNYLKENLAKPGNIWILGGMTGTGKTDKLQHLEQHGEQVLDLEGYAHHKGSAFGSLGQKNQHHNEQFENDIGEKWLEFDLKKPIWIEDEGKSIGRNYVPEELFLQMRRSPVIKIEHPLEERIKRLMKEYAGFDKNLLIQKVENIRKRLGGLDTQKAVSAIENNDLETAIKIVLNYYDQAYLYGLSKRNESTVTSLFLEKDEQESNVQSIINKMKEICNA